MIDLSPDEATCAMSVIGKEKTNFEGVFGQLVSEPVSRLDWVEFCRIMKAFNAERSDSSIVERLLSELADLSEKSQHRLALHSKFGDLYPRLLSTCDPSYLSVGGMISRALQSAVPGVKPSITVLQFAESIMPEIADPRYAEKAHAICKILSHIFENDKTQDFVAQLKVLTR
jgi:hypothetical protein